MAFSQVVIAVQGVTLLNRIMPTTQAFILSSLINCCARKLTPPKNYRTACIIAPICTIYSDITISDYVTLHRAPRCYQFKGFTAAASRLKSAYSYEAA